ncbi:MAG: HAMP domain-containing protein [Anaerolineae bacterium]|nr:HAMP domain-containing protein [Anaerolineae bacterium]
MSGTRFEKWIYRFWMVAGAVNIRVKILGIVLALVLLLGFTVTLQVRALLTRSMYIQLEEQAISITRDLAARAVDPILINNLYALQQLMMGTQTTYPTVRYVFIVDIHGYILAHTFQGGFPEGLIEANTASSDAYQHTIVLQTDEGQIWDTAVPIFDGRAGTARVGLSDANVIQTLNVITGQLLLTTILVSTVGVTAAVLLTWVLTRPILALVQATKAVEKGDFSQHVPQWADDEIGELARAFNAMTDALAKSNAERIEREQLRAQYVSGVITAQEDERKRIARELHDSTGQSLTSMMLGLKALADACQVPELQRRAEELRNVAGQTLDDVHSLSLQLRPSVLDDLGLPEAIRRHVADCRKRYSLAIDLAIQGMDEGRLPTEVETALYRIIQEALTNVVRHSNARTASVFIERTQAKVLAIIEDDGKGFNQSEIDWLDGHLGLYGIRERTELLSGQLTLETAINQGTSLFVEIPLVNEKILE